MQNQNDQQPEKPAAAAKQTSQHPPTHDYYKQLREGTQDFDPKTAEALLMKVNMEANVRSHEQAAGQKRTSILTLILFPWRLFDPATANSARRTVFVLIFVLILILAAYILPTLVR